MDREIKGNGNMRTTLLISASEQYWRLLELMSPNALEYCLRHRLQLSIKRHQDTSSGVAVSIERIKYMIEALTGCDVLWFAGVDTLIMNHTIDCRQFVDPNYDFIIGQDVNGINNDSFFIRNTPDSLEFLYKCLNYLTTKGSPNCQEAMILALNDLPNYKCKIVHQKLFNSYLYSEYEYKDDKGGSFTEGDFLLHLPAIYNERRIILMKKYVQKVIK